MAVPILKLDLAPPSTLWRLNHAVIGWAALVAGGLVLAGSLGFTLRTYRQAALAGQLEVLTKVKARRTEEETRKVVEELRNVDVTRELPRWRLAERIYTERSLPWSRLTAELERSLVQDVRIKSLQRTRGSDLKVQMKVKGEARSREAEAAFVEALQKNPFFEQVILEREGERQGGGVDFEYTLAAFSIPPPYEPLPKYGPKPKVAAVAAPAPAKVLPRAPAIPAPRPAAPAVAQPVPQPAAETARPMIPPRFMPGQPGLIRPPRAPRPRPSTGGGEE